MAPLAMLELNLSSCLTHVKGLQVRRLAFISDVAKDATPNGGMQAMSLKLFCIQVLKT